MELVKKNIHMNKLRCKSTLQLTLDDDFNVPDIKPDIDKIITEQGDIRINEIKSMNGKLMVKGVLGFNVLYLCDGDPRPIHNISGEIPFDEVINMEQACMDDDPVVKWELEDLSTGLINSRKLSVKSIIRLNVSIEDLYDEETAVMVDGPEDIQYINERIEITDVCINKKDIFRIKDELVLPTNQGRVSSILYSDVQLNNVEVRLLEDKFTIKGELPIFLLYTSEDEENPIEYFETEIPFNGTIECNGCTEDMVEDITCGILSKNLEIKPDMDGEERLLDLEVILDMNIKVYVIEQPEILRDIYSPSMEISPIIRNATYENLVIKNNSKYRLVERIRVPENQPRLLQICHGSGSIKVDDIIAVGNDLQVDGAIEVNILYVAEDDIRPMNSLKSIIPFSQIIDVKGIKPNSTFDIKPSLDQLSITMLDGDEIEVKAMMNLNTIVFDQITESIITDIDVQEIDMEKVQSMPGIIGYVVRPEETLWNIAKKFYTTVDNIMMVNNMDDERVREGDKLIILKQVTTIL